MNRRSFVRVLGATGLTLSSAGVAAAKGPAENRNFRTHMTGDEEVPPVDTDAQGQAKFKLAKDGSTLDYKLIVANIENVLMAHIHQAHAGQNGPFVTWLYPVDGPPPQLIPGRFDGVLAEGLLWQMTLSARSRG
ncbi:MAG: CHRD domain-containing protein [Halobacteriales archaeon]|nr:CHRD domain-containing protein [Halobacteriales archaeon]